MLRLLLLLLNNLEIHNMFATHAYGMLELLISAFIFLLLSISLSQLHEAESKHYKVGNRISVNPQLDHK